jgi:hypothetical protein
MSFTNSKHLDQDEAVALGLLSGVSRHRSREWRWLHDPTGSPPALIGPTLQSFASPRASGHDGRLAPKSHHHLQLFENVRTGPGGRYDRSSPSTMATWFPGREAVGELHFIDPQPTSKHVRLELAAFDQSADLMDGHVANVGGLLDRQQSPADRLGGGTRRLGPSRRGTRFRPLDHLTPAT